MTNAVRVSVVIAVYNAAQSLPKAAQSALEQTERNIEVIIVDDCSTDSSWQAARGLAASDARVRLLRMPQNSGKSSAVNAATRMAKGTWIAVLDADDWYAPERLERLLALAESTHADMVADNQVFVDIQAGVQAGTAFSPDGEDIALDLKAFLKGSNSVSHFDYGMLKPVFRAAFLRAHAIEYYAPARRGQDFYILLDFFVAGGRGVVTRAALYYYVQPYGHVSSQWSQQGRTRYNFELLKEINDHYIAALRSKLSSADMHMLVKRGRGFEIMIAFHKTRECLKAGEVKKAIGTAIHAPPGLWPMIASRAGQRIRKLLLRKAAGK